MICCLLALLAALPGVSMIRSRLLRAQVGQAQCAGAHGEYGLGRDIACSVAAAAVVSALGGTALTVAVHSHDTNRYLLGPICSALDRVVSSR